MRKFKSVIAIMALTASVVLFAFVDLNLGWEEFFLAVCFCCFAVFYEGFKTKQEEPIHYRINHDESTWDMNCDRPRNTQVIQPTLGEKIKLDDYKIIKYQQGHSLFSGRKLKWEHFDWVTYVGKTAHPIKKDEAYSFIGYRDEQPTVLTCDKIK